MAEQLGDGRNLGRPANEGRQHLRELQAAYGAERTVVICGARHHEAVERPRLVEVLEPAHPGGP